LRQLWKKILRQIMGTCLAEVSVTLTAQLFSVLRTTVFTIMTAYWLKLKLNDRDYQTLRIVSKQHRITATLFPHRELHKANTHERAKTIITDTNDKMRKRWCHNHKT
uniref:Uncharacterized protein n=1 Tax=Sinocyclocheilus rhinocerous TaxID=307959 RepID=A0A673IJR9_9TELE